MKRRHFLATAGLVAIAGCSDGGNQMVAGGGMPPSNNSTEGNQTDNNGSAEDPPAGPTDPELATEHITDAQDALQAAVNNMNRQGGQDRSLSSGFDATVSLDTTPIEDSLTDVRDALDETDDLEMRGEQKQTVNSLEDAEAFVRAVVDVQPALNDLHSSVSYLLEDTKAGEWDRVNNDIVDVRRAYDSLDTGPVDRTADPADGKMGFVDALTDDDVIAQEQRVVGEGQTISNILDGIETLKTAKGTYDEAVDAKADGEYHDSHTLYGDAGDGYSALSGLSGYYAFGGGAGWLSCIGKHMTQACEYRQIAVNRRINGGDYRTMDERADDEMDKADNCELPM